MSCVEQQSIETEDFTSKKEGEGEMSMPLAVADSRMRIGDSVVGRVTEALNLQLERGSMPA
jgi:hypothetical protein